MRWWAALKRRRRLRQPWRAGYPMDWERTKTPLAVSRQECGMQTEVVRADEPDQMW